MAACPKCGAPIEGRFCGGCGASVDVSGSSGAQWGASPQPPAAISSRKSPESGGAVRRPDDSTALVHRHDAPIAAGARVEVGEDDVFYGVVEQNGARAVGFALMKGTRTTPGACEGYFVSRGMDGVELDHELGDVASTEGRHAIVRVRGQLALEIGDPIRLLASEAPLDDEALGARVIGAFVDALESAVKGALADEELTLESICDGAADGRLLDRVTGERGAAKALRAHGLVAEVGALHVEGEMISAPIGGMSATQERTMPEATFIERPSGETGALYVHGVPMTSGTIVTVDVTDVFVGVAGDGSTKVFPTGRHRLESPFVAGAFVQQRPQTLRFGVPLGHVRDFKAAEADLRAYGTIELRVEDAAALVAGLEPLSDVEPETLVDRVRAAAADALGGVVRDGLGGGEWDLGSVSDDAEVAEACRRAAKAYGSVEHTVRGTSIQFRDLHVSVGASTGGAPRTLESEPPAEPDTAEPVDDEFERTALPSAQYPPPEASERTFDGDERREESTDEDDGRGPDGPDSVMPTAVTEPGYADRILKEAGMLKGPASQARPAAVPARDEPMPRSQIGLAKPLSVPRPEPKTAPASLFAAEVVAQEKSFTQPTPSPFAQPAAPPQPPVVAAAMPPMQPIRPMGSRSIGGAASEPPPAAQPVQQEIEVPPQIQPAVEVAPQPAAAGFSVGSYVFVLWSDGNRYPGQVQQATGEHCLVLFSNGHQQWVPMHALAPA